MLKYILPLVCAIQRPQRWPSSIVRNSLDARFGIAYLFLQDFPLAYHFAEDSSLSASVVTLNFKVIDKGLQKLKKIIKWEHREKYN